MSERDIFEAALECTPDELARFLDGACAGNAELRQQVEQLLAAHARAGTFLEQPAEPQVTGGYQAEPDRVVVEPQLSERPGERIGPYKLLQKLGEGGMGTVWVAEQEHPVKRRVALKLIKPGMDSGQVLRRFEAERQALALMDHTNIAKVLEAGATPFSAPSQGGTWGGGRPYFAMELVKGVPITRYCDELHLSLRERLELFVQVCAAIQHAHQKGIIHRDIKPSNVLVAVQDGRPVPKVIDFGVAKAMQQRLTEESMYTEIGQIIGTLEYMSPEQAELSALDIDTRTDIYALGVLLYELLTGTTPLDRKRLKDAALADMLRIIKEVDPPKPSTRLTDSKESLASLAAQRRTEPDRLTRDVRGELDLIVMKCLEKDRTRRYETANGLARDIQRHLNDEPVEACPPSAGYRLRKFARKNRGTLVTASALAFLLIAGTGVSTWQAVRATRAEARAVADRDEREQARKAEAKQKLAAQAAEAAEKQAKQDALAREAETKAVLEFVENKVFAAARPKNLEGGLGYDVPLHKAIEAAVPYVEKSFANQPLIEARLRMTLGASFFYLGEDKIAAEQFQAARTLFTKHRGPDHRDTLNSMNNLANCYEFLGRYADALKLREETLALYKPKFGRDDPSTLNVMHNLASSYSHFGRFADAAKLGEETVARMKFILGPEHVTTLKAMSTLSNSYRNLGRHAEALKLGEETLALRKATLGPDHRDTLISMFALARIYAALGRHAEALKLFQETLELQKAILGLDHPYTLQTMGVLSENYATIGRHADAIMLGEEVLVLQKAKYGRLHVETLITIHYLTKSYAALGRYADALKLHEETLTLTKAKYGPDNPRTLNYVLAVVEGLVKLDRGAEAVPIIDDCLKRAAGKAVQPQLIPSLVDSRLRHFEKSKDAAGCRATAEMWEKLNRSDANSLYNAACFRAVTATLVKQDPKTPGADAARLAREEADRAMTWLRQAVAAGYKDTAHMAKDKDLDALRNREDFKKLVSELGAKK
jgi:serine/threonine protein kinase/tetratricopeptide (TPR) repeat protein